MVVIEAGEHTRSHRITKVARPLERGDPATENPAPPEVPRRPGHFFAKPQETGSDPGDRPLSRRFRRRRMNVHRSTEVEHALDRRSDQSVNLDSRQRFVYPAAWDPTAWVFLDSKPRIQVRSRIATKTLASFSLRNPTMQFGLTVLLIAYCSCAAATGQGQKQKQGEPSIPMTLAASGHVIVPLFVGTEGPFRFLVDTGADRIVLDTSLKERLGLKTIRKASMRGAGSGSQPIEIAAPIELATTRRGPEPTADRLTFSDQQPVILPLGRSLGARRLPFDGIIGAPLFEQHILRFDWVTKRVTFLARRPAVKGIGGELALAIEQGFPFLAASLVPLVKGQPRPAITGKIMIDLGSFHPVLIDWPIVRDQELLDPADPQQFAVVAGRGIGGKISPFKNLPIRRLRIAGFEVEHLRAVLRTKAGGRPPVAGRIGHLGLGFLCDYVTTFDYANGRLVIDRPHPRTPVAALAANLLGYREVRAELQLSEAQDRRAREYSRQVLAAIHQRIGETITQDQDTPAGALAVTLPDAIDAIVSTRLDRDATFATELMTGAQLVRFQQLQNQRRGAYLLHDVVIRTQLALSIGQRVRIDTALARDRTRRGERLTELDPESPVTSLRTKQEQQDRVLRAKLTRILSPKQRRRLARVYLGAEFTLPDGLPG